MLWDSGLEKLGQQWNSIWSAVEFQDAFAGPDGTYLAVKLYLLLKFHRNLDQKGSFTENYQRNQVVLLIKGSFTENKQRTLD